MNILRNKLVTRSLWGALAGAGIYAGVHYLSSRHVEASMGGFQPGNLAGGGSDYSINLQRVNEKRSAYRYKSREQHLKEIEQTAEFDVIVIGGGCTGAGITFNTSTAGLKTLMIDSHDFSAGTSSKSTKLLHGGSFG